MSETNLNRQAVFDSNWCCSSGLEGFHSDRFGGCGAGGLVEVVPAQFDSQFF